MPNVTIDTETCGLVGLPTLIQYAYGLDGKITIHDVWGEPIIKTLELIHSFTEAEYVQGFNLGFDWFMLCKLYTTFSLYHDLYEKPQRIIQELAILEEQARFQDMCLKPRSALDLMLVARKTKYQSLMAREDIKIRRVPTPIAYKLANFLERAVKIDDIYFAKQKDKFAPRWKVLDINKPDGSIDPNFKSVKLKFRAGSGLKHLARFALGEKVIFHKDIEVERQYWPVENEYAPFALSVATKLPSGEISWNGSWPDVIEHHIIHWRASSKARLYAANDVDYTRRLAVHLGNPEHGDDDSVLACEVAAARWKGYAIDIPRLMRLKEEAERRIKATPTAPKQARIYISAMMDDMEKIVFSQGTKKAVLEEISKWQDDENQSPHKAAIRAQEVLSARKAQKEIDLYKKLILAKRFHAEFVVIGTLSNRMGGAGGLNAQGINHLKTVRSCFLLADQEGITPTFRGSNKIVKVPTYKIDSKGTPNWSEDDSKTNLTISYADIHQSELDGGDFKSFEVGIADAVFDDPKLRADLKSGKKIHALFAMELYPGKTYEEILASDGQYPDYYDGGKKGVFTIFFGGDENTLKNKYNIPLEVGQMAYQGFCRKYQQVGIKRAKISDLFCSMRQPGGLGSRVEWHEPADYIESLLGFRRYFTLENKICKVLFDLAQAPPEDWKMIKIKVQRRERIQTATGATQSALFAAAFGIQSANMRAANNHVIQSTGATITKAVQRSVWDIQPSGVHEWLVSPMNIHDELMTPLKTKVRDLVEQKVNQTIEKYRKYVPLLAIDWFHNMPNWAQKKG